jgi:hypothetical protein
MKRREFITLLGGAVVAESVAARAEQPVTPVIGYLTTRGAGEDPQLVAAFRQGLKEAGYVEGRNAAIEFRWADGRYERLTTLAADLVGRQVALIFAGPLPATVAAKAATSTIPIVFANGNDPVAHGLVTSLNRPGGNITGVSFLVNLLAATLEHVGVIFRPHPRAVVGGRFPTGTGLHRRDPDQNQHGAASGMAPRGMRLMAKVPHGQKAKPYVQKRKTYLLQSRQVS